MNDQKNQCDNVGPLKPFKHNGKPHRLWPAYQGVASGPAHTSITTLPTTCPASTVRCASATWFSAKRWPMLCSS